MDEVDAEGRVDEERLSFGGGEAAGGGVADVADAHAALEGIDSLLVEDVRHQAVVLALLEAGAVKGDHARAVLTAVLEHEQPFVELGGDLAFVAKYADDAAHARDVPVELLTGEIVRRGETREMRAVSVRGHTHGAFRGSREKQTIAFLTMP